MPKRETNDAELIARIEADEDHPVGAPVDGSFVRAIVEARSDAAQARAIATATRAGVPGPVIAAAKHSARGRDTF